jgi:hypothetical protein
MGNSLVLTLPVPWLRLRFGVVTWVWEEVMDKYLIQGYGNTAYHPSYLETGDDGIKWHKDKDKATVFSLKEARQMMAKMPKSKWIRRIAIIPY